MISTSSESLPRARVVRAQGRRDLRSAEQPPDGGRHSRPARCSLPGGTAARPADPGGRGRAQPARPSSAGSRCLSGQPAFVSGVQRRRAEAGSIPRSRAEVTGLTPTSNGSKTDLFDFHFPSKGSARQEEASSAGSQRLISWGSSIFNYFTFNTHVLDPPEV